MRGIVGKSINLSGLSQLQCACNHLACFTSLSGTYSSPTLLFQFLEHSQHFFFLPQDLCAYCLCLDCLDCLAFGMGGFVLTFGSQLFNIILKINLFFFSLLSTFSYPCSFLIFLL